MPIFAAPKTQIEGFEDFLKLEERAPGKVCVFSTVRGGNFSVILAARPEVGCYVGYHSALVLHGWPEQYQDVTVMPEVRKLRTPTLLMIGGADFETRQNQSKRVAQYLRAKGVPFHIETQDTYSIVTRVIPAGRTMSSLCSRLRRGVLYRVASELGATKIALGHHREDILGTFFLNLFYGGTLKGMPPKLVSGDGRHVVIRPLAYVKEDDLARYAEVKAFPIIPCNLCG